MSGRRRTPSQSRPAMESLEPRWLLDGSVPAGAGDPLAGADVSDYVVRWTFDESGGSVAHDESAGGFDADVLGAAWTEGHDGNALRFDNLDDYLDNDANGLIGAVAGQSQGSISVWFRIDSLPTGGAVQSVFYMGDGGGASTDSFHIEVGHFNDSQQRRLYFTLIKSGQVRMCFDSSGFELIEAGRWYHFVGVVGPDYNTGFLNGREMIGRHYNVGTTAADHYWLADLADPTVSYTGRGVLGNRSRWDYFDGLIDEIRIYDRPLDASEVALLYSGEAPPAVTTLARTGRPNEMASLAATFNTDVGDSVDPGDLSLYNRTASSPVDMGGVTVEYDFDTHTATWDLSSVRLPAGLYEATLASAGLSDLAGRYLDGDGDGSAGGDYVVELLVAPGGDATLDGIVGIADLSALADNYGVLIGAAWGQGDFTGDGVVGIADLSLLADNYGSDVTAGRRSASADGAATLAGPAGTATASAPSEAETDAETLAIPSLAGPGALLPVADGPDTVELVWTVPRDLSASQVEKGPSTSRAACGLAILPVTPVETDCEPASVAGPF